MRKWRILGCSAALLLLSMAAAGCAVKPVYYLNDDVTMRSIVSGACTGVPDGHAVYMKYPLTGSLAVLYSLMQRLHLFVPWFDLFLGGCILLAGAGILARCVELSHGKSMLWRITLPLAGVLVFAGLLLPHYLYIHYTVVAAISAASALFLWVSGSSRGLPVTLLVLCYLVRSQVFFLALPFLLVAVLDELSEGSSAPCAAAPGIAEAKEPLWARFAKRALPPLLPVFTLGVAVTLLGGVDQVAYGSPQWRSYRAYNDSRTKLYDYTDFLSTDRYQELYGQLGLDRQQYQVLAHYDLLLDAAVDGATMEEAAERIGAMGAAGTGSGYLWQCIKQYYLHVRYDGRPYSLLWGCVLLLLVFLLTCNKSWKKLSLLAALLMGRSLIWVYLIARGRFPERIWLSLYLIETCLLLGMLLRECAKRQESARRGKENAAAVGCLVLCLFLLCLAALKQLPETLRRTEEQQEKQVCWNRLTDFLEETQVELYLTDVFSVVPYAGELYGKDSGQVLLLGGWLAGSPLARQRLAVYGAQDGAQALRHPQVRLLMDGDRDIAWLEEYLEERLGTMELQLRESIVCGEGIEFVIYQLSEREVSFGEAAKSYGGCLEAYEEDTGFGRESMYKGSAGDVIGDRFDAGVLGGPLYPRISHESYGRQHYHRTGFPGA